MTLAQIERIVLMLIGGDRYSALSVDTIAEKIEDFANLHTCVNLAREEIKLNTTIPSLLQWTAATATVVGTRIYSLPADFDVPVKVFYTDSGDEFELDQVYPANLKQKIDDLTAQGTPSVYMILGQSATRVQIEFYNIPSVVGSYRAIYKPTLTTLSTSTDEDIIMLKYPKAVINIATSFAFEIIKKDTKRADEYYLKGLKDCRDIDLRETKADSNYRELPDSLTRSRRQARLSR